MKAIVNFVIRHAITIFYSGWVVMILNLVVMGIFMPRCTGGIAELPWYLAGLTVMMIGLMMVIVPLMMSVTEEKT